jgi:hypothetical protein
VPGENATWDSLLLTGRGEVSRSRCFTAPDAMAAARAALDDLAELDAMLKETPRRAALALVVIEHTGGP